MSRKCSVCGKTIKTYVDEKGHYKGGHYFGKINTNPKSENWHDMKGNLVQKKIKGEKPKLVEYWECDKCYESG